MGERWRVPTRLELASDLYFLVDCFGEPDLPLWTSTMSSEQSRGFVPHMSVVKSGGKVEDVPGSRLCDVRVVRDTKGGGREWGEIRKSVSYAQALEWVGELNAPLCFDEFELMKSLAKKFGYVLTSQSKYEEWSEKYDLR